MRFVYRLLALLLTPLALIRLERGPVANGERGRWRERLGLVPDGHSGRVWLHAASVGEVNAAEGLIKALLARGEPLMVSTMTRSGAARCRALFGERLAHRYLPLDNAGAVRAWLRHTRPRLGLIVETEIWPELYWRCHQLGIPILMVSARLSEPAYRRYARFRGLLASTLPAVELALAQSHGDGEKLIRLGLPKERVRISGNLKFDLSLPDGLEERGAALRQSLGHRATWAAGSTRPGEEDLLIESHMALRQAVPDATLLLAPRHPERVAAVAELLDASGLDWCRWGESAQASAAVVLVDRLGVLLECYAAADAGFVGGSLVPLGGHNLLEPASLARPVLAGPHLDQQAEAVAALLPGGGLKIVGDASELSTALTELLTDPEQARATGAAAFAGLQSGSGSLQATLAALEPWLEATAATD